MRDFSNPENTNEKLKKIDVYLLRFEQKRARFKMIDRKQDTRRKIQLGGLVKKARLENLPTAVILGLLLEASEALENDNDKEIFNRWRLKGDIELSK